MTDPTNSRNSMTSETFNFETKFSSSIETLNHIPISYAPSSSGALCHRWSKMPFKRFIEIGRVALVKYDKDYGKLVVIIDVID